MKILVAHQAYTVHGGEDSVVENEVSALKSAGLAIHEFRVQSKLTWQTKWDALSAPFGKGLEEKLERALETSSPDVLHAHNLYPTLSPRIFQVARRRGIKTVLTLHNYRPLCLNGLFLTPAQEICERCAGHTHFLPGIQRGCYRGSRWQSLALSLHVGTARRSGWYNAVDRFIAPSQFLKSKFAAHGFPLEKITVQGHFVPSPSTELPVNAEPYVLYLGRLSDEKGIRWLVNTFQNPTLPLRLRVAGSGPLEEFVKSRLGSSIDFAGYLQGDSKIDQIRRATALVMTSECYENFPLAIAEANSLGTPALVPRLGGLEEMVKPRINGEHYHPKDPASFWKALQPLSGQSLDQRRQCQAYARDAYSRAHFLESRMKLYESLL